MMLLEVFVGLLFSVLIAVGAATVVIVAWGFIAELRRDCTWPWQRPVGGHIPAPAVTNLRRDSVGSTVSQP